MRSPCAHYVFQQYWGSIDGPIVGPPCAHDARIVRPLCVSTLFGFKRFAHNGARLRPLGAHFTPTMTSSRLGVQSMAAQSGHYALFTRPLYGHLGLQPLWHSIEGPTVGPLCAHDALAMCPLCLQAALGSNLWAHSRAIMRLRCAYYAPTLGFNRFGVQSKGPQWGR